MEIQSREYLADQLRDNPLLWAIFEDLQKSLYQAWCTQPPDKIDSMKQIYNEKRALDMVIAKVKYEINIEKNRVSLQESKKRKV